ncbi:FtsW/RodA/SpoVE family cell cycle protein [Protaetiibacter larvae]|uniref:FtsW/RodA/SpoVE family cell cycle protein n=1 Tax=Protaetiibacter larvae TaxID=2592654 RepID=UPI001FEBEB11|nr:FtsW/RodA/SpoVE family cell cycle protein [Protaetiibacter larvae]
MSTFTGSIRIRLRAPARRRNLELFLLLIALGLAAGALALVELGARGETDAGMFALAAVPAVLVLVLHLAERVVAAEADPFVVPIASFLNGLGIAMIHRLDIAEGYEGWDAYGVRQVVWSSIALVLAITGLLVVRNHRVLQRYRFIAMFVGVVLLLLPVIPGIGDTGANADVWVRLGFFSFQPGEFAKIALAVFFAGYLVTARDSLSMVGRKVLGLRFPRARDLGPILVVWVLSMGVIVIQRDLGTALLYFGLFLVMLYVATGRGSWILIGLALFAGGAWVATRILPYVQGRFRNWLDAFNPEIYEASGGSFQLVQGLFGLADGGLVGTGLGRGRPDIVPLAESDYIVASLGEELGLIGLFAILCLYLVFVARGFRIGVAGQDDFGRLLAVGLSFVVGLQVFIVIGGVTRVIPLTGLTTPFLAAGGSSLVANWIIVALLLRLSDSVRQQPHAVVEGGQA